MSGISVPLDGSGRAAARRDTFERSNIPQLRIRGILAIWAAAALPMAVLAWLVAPVLADRFAGDGQVPMAKALIVCLTIGLVWQFVLVAILVAASRGPSAGRRCARRSGSAHREARAADGWAAVCGWS